MKRDNEKKHLLKKSWNIKTNLYKFEDIIFLKKYFMKRTSIAILIVFLLFPISVQTVTSTSGITLKNDYVEFKFSEDFVLQSIQDLNTSRIYYFEEAPLWKLILLDVEKAGSGNLNRDVFKSLLSNDPSLNRDYNIDHQPNQSILSLIWQSEILGEVRVEIILPKNSAISTWSISIENNNNRYSIWYVEFPYLTIKPIEDDKNNMFLAMPFHSGILVRNPIDNIDWQVEPWEEIQSDQDKNNVDKKGLYPGGYDAQFAALYNLHGDGIYIAAYDGEMYTKRFLFNGNGKTLLMTIRNYPDKMLTPARNYEIPYRFKIGVFAGDWMDASDIYRNWACNQEWCKKGPMYKQRDLSKALQKIDITTGSVYRHSLEEPIKYDEIKEDLLNMKEFFNTYASVDNSSVGIGIHWKEWSKHLEKAMPNYFPAQEGFSNMIDELHSAGDFYCDVYIGTAVFDTANPVWPDDEYTWEEAEPYACYNPMNQTYKKFQPTYACMDPSTDWWQNLLASLAVEAQEELHIDGTYWDHYPKAKLEFRHHEGGGNFYALGYRAMLSNIKNVTTINDPNHYTYPEGKSEIEVGVLDGMASEFFYSDEQGYLHSFGWNGIPTPIIPYLYHDYIVGVGGIRTSNRDFCAFRNRLEFRAVEATFWVWGNKPKYPFLDSGRPENFVFTKWKNGELDPLWVENLTYLAELVKMYKLGKNALLFGRMIRPPVLEGINKEMINLNGQDFAISSILSSAFKTSDGEIYIPITNWVEDIEKIKRIDFSKCNWLPDSYEMFLLNESGLQNLGVYTDKIVDVNINMKPRDAGFIIIKETNQGVTIIKPRDALYVFDKKIIPLPLTIVIGGITIETEVYGEINTVDFYIDGELKYADDTPPYSWFWDEYAIGEYKIKVIAYDDQGNKMESTESILMFNL